MNGLSFLCGDKKVDAYVISSKINRFYFTNFSSSFGYLIVTPETKVFVTDYRYQEEAHLALHSFGYEVESASGVDVVNVIIAKLKAFGAVNVAIEDKRLTYHEYSSLSKQFHDSGLKALPIGDEIELLRSVKTEQELQNITLAQELCCKAYEKILSFVKPGMSEIDVAVELEYLMRKLGGRATAFDTIVACGVNTSKPHARPTMRKIQNGDLVILDFGTEINGYCSDITRTFGVGKVSDELKHLYDCVLNANSYAIANIKAGMTCIEADSFAREALRSAGFEKEFCHSLGHGVGLEVHEEPSVSSKNKMVLKENMVISIEPGVYISGVAGVRIEDLVIVKNDGLVNITTANKEFKII